MTIIALSVKFVVEKLMQLALNARIYLVLCVRNVRLTTVSKAMMKLPYKLTTQNFQIQHLKINKINYDDYNESLFYPCNSMISNLWVAIPNGIVTLWRIEPSYKIEQFEIIIDLKRSHKNFIKPDNRSVKESRQQEFYKNDKSN